MRLDFNVLWVEDQPSEVRPQIDGIQRRMAEEGFLFKPTICENISKVSAKLADHLFSDEVDLIMVDWELGGGEQGQDAIEKVRETIRYKDIVFYSARADIKELHNLAHQKGQEGIYFCRRADLVNEVIGVFDSLIKKALDLDHIRGIVMGATSDIDHLAREMLLAAHAKSSETDKAGILAEMIERLDNKISDLSKSIDKLKESPSVEAILAAHHAFTANDGLRILARLLETDSFADHGAYRADVTEYITSVVPKRNILGHKVLTPEGIVVVAGATAGETISFAEMKELRRALLQLRERFKELHTALTS